jgi:hypothetical protein
MTIAAADKRRLGWLPRNEWRGRWLCVRLDRVSLRMLEDLLLEAWALVAPKALVKAFVPSR